MKLSLLGEHAKACSLLAITAAQPDLPPSRIVAGREVVAQLHLQALERLDELHRVFAAAEFRLLHADFERVHCFKVRLNVAVRQRP